MGNCREVGGITEAKTRRPREPLRATLHQWGSRSRLVHLLNLLVHRFCTFIASFTPLAREDQTTHVFVMELLAACDQVPHDGAAETCMYAATME